jgi:hypothetical protein
MNKPNWQDIWGGALVIAFGLYVAAYAYLNLNLGTLRRMGAGAFPFGVGIILVVLGVLIVLPALVKPGPKIELSIRTPIIILAAVCAFAIVMPILGIFPAIFVTVFISALADKRLTPGLSALITVGLCAAVWLVFKQGLNLQFPIFDWSW